MYKTGLKLWSVNTDFYLNEAKKLYDNGFYDYIELYVVPESLNTLEYWKKLNIPFIIHNAHFAHGFNLAKTENKQKNREIYGDTKRFADELNAKYIIFHGGMDGNIEETAKQLANFNEPRALIENKPYIAPKGEKRHCRGYSIEEISQVMSQTGCGFCLDIGHAVCAANSINKEPYAYLAEFNKLNPQMYHISGNYIDSTTDRHLHLYEGNFNINKIFNIINDNAYISIETNKDSKENLDDLKRDIMYLRKVYEEKKSSIHLEKFNREHIVKTFDFINYSNVSKYFARNQKATFESHVQYWEKSLSDVTQMSYAIYCGEEHIGNCGIKKMNNNSGEMWKYIAEKEYLGKGYGKIATKFFLRECFESLMLDVVYSVTDVTNERNITLNKKFGFEICDFDEEDKVFWGDSISHLIKLKLEKDIFYKKIKEGTL